MSPDDFKSVMPLVTGSVAALTFARLVWLPNTRAERAKQLGTSLGNLKAWVDFGERASSPLTPAFIDDQKTRSAQEVERDAIALAEGTAWSQLWLFASFFFTMGGLWLTIYKMDEVVRDSRYAWAWWIFFLGGSCFVGLSLWLDHRRTKVASSVPKALDTPEETAGGSDGASPNEEDDG